ncbi:hypothetical protein Cfor_12094 [Coptotermes formosanus]|uniref:Major facilitator superfamily associated domain-containing protein n=1 Tax=Coptotermes formosanus TaxID=36987 RepID=A0A6L2PKJ8_COPFO|nr:hypothetical protein Cfor_12094 [Coptotermes formosanus]
MVGMDRMVSEEDGYIGQQQRIPMATPGIRPMVNPEALGEVDPEKYPQPKESTHKIRGRSDIIEFLCGAVDPELLTVKTFYFFFYSAFGSLFPLMGVYFKQMGMNPGQCGLLIGSRPFIEFLSAPFWGSLADRWQKGKMLLLASLSAWIIFTLPLGLIQPPATSCILKENHTYVLKTLAPPQPVYKREVDKHTLSLLVDSDIQKLGPSTTDINTFLSRHSRAFHQPMTAGQSPLDVQFASNYKESEHSNWVSPLFSSIVYRTQDIQKVFFLLLLLVIIGEFFSAPAITLADSAVITLLGEDADRYGHQRMFGSLGWGLAMFFVGIALDHSTSFPEHPCGPDAKEKNYTICFATFSVLMGAALITATQITFKYDFPQEPEPSTQEKQPPELSHEDTMQQQLAQQLNLPQLADTNSLPVPTKPPPPQLQTKMFAQTTREIPEWVTVLKQFANLKCGSFLFVAWFMGFGIGLIFTFLFWHLQDYGGSPTLFGVASVINHVLCLGLAGNVLRFLYISWLKNPWWVLPFEFMQGITHAAVWAACCSYIAHNTPQQLRSSAQGVLQGIHHGLGRGCGAVIGGIFVNYFGTTATFRGYGFICALVLAAFVFINFYRKETGFVSELPAAEDPHQVAEETAHLAPHGVPSNPIPRALSSSRLHELAGPDQSSYGATYQTTGGNLDIPGQQGTGGTTNPFLQNGGGGGYNYSYRHGETKEEYIRRNFQMYSEVLAQYEGAKPSPALTRLHTQQPGPHPEYDSYDW